ncbi:hypothetical protein DL96DRAFT_1826202 [Flagelloscypha sp. PMI_526]|nr:hypothetical protein DL96DRAFT_1826202 [Flagelloscypha sp. PMI_526]
MPLFNLVDELLTEIVTFVEPDLQSLKKTTLVNQRLGSIARYRLFSRYTVHIRSVARMGMVGVRHLPGHTSAKFVAMLRTSPRLASLVHPGQYGIVFTAGNHSHADIPTTSPKRPQPYVRIIVLFEGHKSPTWDDYSSSNRIWRLGHFVKHLTVAATSDVPLPFKYLPFLEVLDIVIQARKYNAGESYTTDLDPIIWLNQSLLGQKDVHLSQVILTFASFPASFGPKTMAMATFTECDKLLEESCPGIRSLHATFGSPLLTDISTFSLMSAQQELGELFA